MIIEYLHIHHPGPVRLIPDDADAALKVRTIDRFFDNYVATPQQKLVFDRSGPKASATRTASSRRGRCSTNPMPGWSTIWPAANGRRAISASPIARAGPMLFYADWTHPIPEPCVNVRNYRRRLIERPAFARAIDEARPYRSYFPLGAPDRD